MLIGRDAPRLREALANTDVPLHDHETLEAATQAAAQLAQPGDAVLLSPACASFDMFKNYAHRADVFRQAVADIAADRGVML
jgi:UDP-N-acetylmuramoylalanine--D-glutamate ligase